MEWVWITNVLSLVLLLVIAVFVLSVKPYFTNLSTEIGKIDAMQQRINELGDVAQAKGYGEEKGKRLATHEDIENVLRELRLVTKETESIKAQISGDLWNRQTAWTHRMAAYSAALGGMFDVRHRLLRLSEASVDSEKDPESGMPIFETAWKNLTDEITRYNQLSATAILVGDNEIDRILTDSQDAIRTAFHQHPQRVRKGMAMLDKVILNFKQTARSRLRLD